MSRIEQKVLPVSAGLYNEKIKNTNTGTAECLQFENRPNTPENIKKYRKSYFSEPGAHITHPGKINDIEKIDKFKKFGQMPSSQLKKIASTNNNHTNDNILFTSDPNILNKNENKFTLNQREPLGKSFIRGHILPSKVNDPNFAFGKKAITTSSPSMGQDINENAKELIYPYNNGDIDNNNNSKTKTIEPGEQKKRDYTWKSAGIDDPANFEFGYKKKDETNRDIINGSHENSKTYVVVKAVDDMKSTKDIVGKPRNLGQNSNYLVQNKHIFGITREQQQKLNSRSRDTANNSTIYNNARECIEGNYSEQDQEPDEDLGKSVRRGWHNNEINHNERTFGIPSVRSDISAPSMRSVADNQNYGDDVDAQYLLYPTRQIRR